jgi:hypothetical protein
MVVSLFEKQGEMAVGLDRQVRRTSLEMSAYKGRKWKCILRKNDTELAIEIKCKGRKDDTEPLNQTVNSLFTERYRKS